MLIEHRDDDYLLLNSAELKCDCLEVRECAVSRILCIGRFKSISVHDCPQLEEIKALFSEYEGEAHIDNCAKLRNIKMTLASVTVGKVASGCDAFITAGSVNLPKQHKWNRLEVFAQSLNVEKIWANSFVTSQAIFKQLVAVRSRSLTLHQQPVDMLDMRVRDLTMLFADEEAALMLNANSYACTIAGETYRARVGARVRGQSMLSKLLLAQFFSCEIFPS